MNSEQGILAGGVVILTLGLAKDAITGQSPKHVIAGSLIVIMFASLLALGGGDLARLASAIVGLAVVTAILIEGIPLAQALNTVTTK